MKKKLFGLVLAAVLVVAQATTVMAAGSKELGTTAADATASVEQAENLTAAEKETVQTALTKAQAGDLSGIQALPGGELVSCGVFNANSVNVSLKGLSIPSNAKRVYVMHFSLTRKIWECVSANWDGETLTATLKDLSPIVVVADVEVDRSYNDDDEDVETTSSGSAAASGTSAAGASAGVATSPKTGVASDWALWIVAAAALAAVSGAAAKRSRN